MTPSPRPRAAVRRGPPRRTARCKPAAHRKSRPPTRGRLFRVRLRMTSAPRVGRSHAYGAAEPTSEARVRRRARPVTGTVAPFTAIPRLEELSVLDPYIEVVVNAVQTTVPQAARDVLHGVPGGHPCTRCWSRFPVGAWTSAAVLDLLPGARRASGVPDRDRPGRRAPCRCGRSRRLGGDSPSAASGRRRARCGQSRRGRVLRRVTDGSGARSAHARSRPRLRRLWSGQRRRGARGAPGLPAGVRRQPRRGDPAHRPGGLARRRLHRRPRGRQADTAAARHRAARRDPRRGNGARPVRSMRPPVRTAARG